MNALLNEIRKGITPEMRSRVQAAADKTIKTNMSKYSEDLRKKITGKISGIKQGSVEAKGSGVNDLINKLQDVDEAAAEELKKKYIDAVKTAAQNKK